MVIGHLAHREFFDVFSQGVVRNGALILVTEWGDCEAAFVIRE